MTPPDGLDDLPPAQHDLEAVEARPGVFASLTGVYEQSYAEALEVAIEHARAPRPAPAVANQPWVAVGPRNVTGRILALAQDPTNALTLYAGSAHGGLWRTIDGGDTWDSLSPAELSVPVGCIAIPRQSPTTLYVGTGSPLPRHVSGRGLYRITVPGPRAAATWDLLAGVDPPTTPPRAARPGRAFRYTRIQVDPDDPTRFWAASQTGLWRCRVPPAGAASFTLDFPPAVDAPAGTPPLSPGPVPPPPGFGWPGYATDVLVARDPRERETVGDKARYLIVYVGVSTIDPQGAIQSGVFRGRYDRTTDTTRWDARLEVPDPPAPFTRVRLALCASRPPRVYAVMAQPTQPDSLATPVFSSDDSGKTWAQREQIPPAANGQADFDLILEVDPDSPDVLLCGAVDLCKSEDGARSWTPIADRRLYFVGDQSQHADYHAALFDGAARRTIWVGNDGGVSVAPDLRLIAAPGPLRFWRKRSHGIQAGQFQSVAIHPALPGLSGGGLQDNGSWLSFGGPTWYVVSGSDGAAFAFDRGAPRRFFPTMQHQLMAMTVVPATTPAFVPPPAGISVGSMISVVVPDVPAPPGAQPGVFESRGPGFGLPGRGPFLMQVVEDPLTGAGGQLLFSAGTSLLPTAGVFQAIAYWSSSPAAGPVGVTPITIRDVSGAPLVPPLGLECSAVAFGPVTAGLVDAWVGASDGRLFVGTNGVAADFVPTATPPPWPPGVPMRVTRIAVHPRDPRIVAVAGVPNVEPILIQIQANGPVGTPFIYQQGSTVAGPLATAANVAIPTVPLTVSFAGAGANAFVANDAWIIDPTGRVTPLGNVAGPGTVTASTQIGLPITVTITSAGRRARADAQFSYRIGGGAAVVQPMAPRFAVPGTLMTLLFGPGDYVQNDSWTVQPSAIVTAAAGNTSTGVLSAQAWHGGRVLLTYDRGRTWTDISEPDAPLPRPDPDPLSLPPCTITSLAWDQSNPTSLFAGTLAGVYVLRNIPSPTGITLTPPGPVTVRQGQTVVLTANVTLTSMPVSPDWSTEVDWSSSAPSASFGPPGPGSLTSQPAPNGTVIRGVAGTDLFRGLFRPGDRVETTAAPIQRRVIVSVDNDTQITVATPFNPPLAGAPYKRGLRPEEGGRLTAVAVGAATITARRGVHVANLVVNVAAPIPPPPAPPLPAPAAPPPIDVAWHPFNDGLPLVLVNDLATVPGRTIMRAATFGRGIYEVDLDPAAPRFHLYVRQTVIEDGRAASYPRAIPAALPGDPRQPTATAVGLDFTHAFDIRVDSAPFKFLEDHADGVEFDEQLAADTLVPLVANAVYVQVHNSGREAVVDVDVNLYFMASPAAPYAPPPGSPVPALGPVGDFYNPPGFDPAAAAAWQRVGPRQRLPRVASGAPGVARFDWVVPDGLGANVALLALCTAASDGVWPPAPADVAALVTGERRAALRIVPVAARAPVSIFIRDGIADDGVRAGATRFGGRSPDVIVVQAEPAAAPDVAFRDLLDPRPQDRIRGGMPNHVYVRVHNRGPVDTTVEIEVWAVPVGADNQPSFGPATWTRLSPTPPAAPLTLAVPTGHAAIAHLEWPAAAVVDPNPADLYKAYVLVALIKTTDNVDPLPDTARIDSLATFWEFFNRMADSENAASRALRFEP